MSVTTIFHAEGGWSIFLQQSSKGAARSYGYPMSKSQGFKRSSFRQFPLSESGVRNASPIPCISLCVKLEYKRVDSAAASISILNRKRGKGAKEHHPSTETAKRKLQKNMHMSSSPVCGLLLILNLQLFSTYPISTGLTDTDMDILKVSLNNFKAWLHYESL